MNEQDAHATPTEVATVLKGVDTPYRGEGEGENEDCSHTPMLLEDASNSSDDELPPIPEEEDDDEDDGDYDQVQDKAVRRSPKRYRMLTPSPHDTSGEEDSESTETPSRPSKLRKVIPVSRLISIDSKHPSLRAKASPKAKPTAGYPSSDNSSDTDTGAAQAKYEEWPLRNVILKRVTQDHRSVFQLQFEWDSRVRHGWRARDYKHVGKGKEHKAKERRCEGASGGEVSLHLKRMCCLLISRGMVASVGMRYTIDSPRSSQGGVAVLCRCIILLSSRTVESWKWSCS